MPKINYHQKEFEEWLDRNNYYNTDLLEEAWKQACRVCQAKENERLKPEIIQNYQEERRR